MYSKCMHIININYKYRDSFIIFYIYIYILELKDASI